MSVDAQPAVVLDATEGTPNSFVVEHKKVLVLFVFMQQGDEDLIVVVGEGAVESVLTFLDSFWVKEAEFGFIILWLIKLLNAVMTELTVVSVYALVSVLQGGAHLDGEIKMRATLVLEVMKIHALLLVVFHLVWAMGYLKS
jgi:hypothetical protein